MANFDEKQLAFIDAVASGAKQYEAYLEVYGGEGLSMQTIKNYAKKVATPSVLRAVEEKKKQFQTKAAELDRIELYEGDCSEITRSRLLEECDYIIKNARPCIFKKLNGVPLTNKDAANVYLKAIELSAKIIGAFEQEDKADTSIEVVISGDAEDLSK